MVNVTERIQRAKVWPATLRIAHWLFGLGTLVLIVTGWLIGSGEYLGEAARDFHYLAAWAFTAGLALRIWLLFSGRRPAGWRDLLPDGRQWQAARSMLRFYLSFGRADLPGWYAHNPLWAPVYLLVLMLLCAQAVTGFLVSWNVSTGGLDALLVHASTSPFIVMFTLLHVAAVVLHDLRGPGADISGMVNGYRVFEARQVDVAGSVRVQAASREANRTPDE